MREHQTRVRTQPGPLTEPTAPARLHLGWLAAGAVLAFLVPFVFTDLLDLPRDLYYAVYAAAVLALLTGWALATDYPLLAACRRRLPWAIALGLLVGVVLSSTVIRNEAETSRPDGLQLIWEVLWRGVVYGMVDGLLLSVFPILTVFAAAQGGRLRASRSGTVLVAVGALVASMVMTAVYHAGYSDFRSGKLAQPVAGDVMWSLPTLLTLNPVGAPIAHAGMHVTAVLHSYETDTFLPPHD